MLDLSFAQNYEAEVVSEIGGGGFARYFYPGASRDGGHDGVNVRIRPRGKSAWLATFSFGPKSKSTATGLYPCPQSDHLCVVSRGRACWVNTRNPECFGVIPLTPIQGVFAVASSGLLVFHDFSRFAGLGVNGVAWKTPSLSWDGFRGVRVDGTGVTGEAWDSPQDKWIRFSIDTRSGLHIGGSSPELLGQGPK